MIINVKRCDEIVKPAWKFRLKIADGLSNGHLLQSQTQMTFFVIRLLYKISISILKCHRCQSDPHDNSDYFFSRRKCLFQMIPNKFQKRTGEVSYKGG